MESTLPTRPPSKEPSSKPNDYPSSNNVTLGVNAKNYDANYSLSAIFSSPQILPPEVNALLTDANPIEVTVHALLHPPSNAFRGGILSLRWAVMTAGWNHFEPRDPDERPVLTKTSKLRTHGRELGIPEAYYNWLCGDDLRYTESEDGFMLTPGYFRGLR